MVQRSMCRNGGNDTQHGQVFWKVFSPTRSHQSHVTSTSSFVLLACPKCYNTCAVKPGRGRLAIGIWALGDSFMHSFAYLFMPDGHSATIWEVNGAMSQVLGGVQRIVETSAQACMSWGGVSIPQLPQTRWPKEVHTLILPFQCVILHYCM